MSPRLWSSRAQSTCLVLLAALGNEGRSHCKALRISALVPVSFQRRRYWWETTLSSFIIDLCLLFKHGETGATRRGFPHFPFLTDLSSPLLTSSFPVINVWVVVNSTFPRLTPHWVLNYISFLSLWEGVGPTIPSSICSLCNSNISLCSLSLAYTLTPLYSQPKPTILQFCLLLRNSPLVFLIMKLSRKANTSCYSFTDPTQSYPGSLFHSYRKCSCKD